MLLRYQGFFAVFETLGPERSRQPGFTAFHVVLRADQGEVLPGWIEPSRSCSTRARPSPRAPGRRDGAPVLVPASRRPTSSDCSADTRVQEVPTPGGYGPTLLEACHGCGAGGRHPGQSWRRFGASGRISWARHDTGSDKRSGGAARPVARLEALGLTAVTPRLFVLDGWLAAGSETRLRPGSGA